MKHASWFFSGAALLLWWGSSISACSSSDDSSSAKGGKGGTGGALTGGAGGAAGTSSGGSPNDGSTDATGVCTLTECTGTAANGCTLQPCMATGTAKNYCFPQATKPSDCAQGSSAASASINGTTQTLCVPDGCPQPTTYLP